MEKKLEIINRLEENKDGIHIREISRLVKTGLPNVKRYLDILEKEKIIKKEKKGNLINIHINYNPRTFSYLKQIHYDLFSQLPSKIQNAVNQFIKELNEKPLIALIFGSYAKNNYSKDSDIDILLVYQELKNQKEIENSAKNISGLTNTKISPIYMDYKTFRENYLDKNDSFSNELRNKVIVLKGVGYYYDLVQEFEK